MIVVKIQAAAPVYDGGGNGKEVDMRVLFVCTGNTCRSPMAEALLREKAKKKGIKISVGSAGLNVNDGDFTADKTICALKKIGVPVKRKRARCVNLATVADYDFIVTMNQEHMLSLIYKYELFCRQNDKTATKSITQKVYTMHDLTGCGNVTDPYEKPQEAYDRVCGLMSIYLDIFIQRIENREFN